MAPHAEPTFIAVDPAKPAPSSRPTSASKSLSHLASYPLISDSLSTLTRHPLGQRTINLTTSAYSTFIAPLSPYLSPAYPYVHRADELAESRLQELESRFPIVKEPTEEIKRKIEEGVKEGISYPRRLAAEVVVRGGEYVKDGREYVLRVFEEESSRAEGGVVGGVKAGVTTGLVVSSELMNALAGYLGRRSEPGSPKAEREEEQPQGKRNGHAKKSSRS